MLENIQAQYSVVKQPSEAPLGGDGERQVVAPCGEPGPIVVCPLTLLDTRHDQVSTQPCAVR